MIHIDAVGTVGGVLTTLCWVPQVMKAVRERDTHSISLPTLIVLSVGVSCWVIYGVALENWPLIIANATSLALILVILAAKLRFG